MSELPRADWFDSLLRRAGLRESQIRAARVLVAAVVVGALLLLVDDLIAGEGGVTLPGAPRRAPSEPPREALSVAAPLEPAAAASRAPAGDPRALRADAPPPGDPAAWERRLNQELAALLQSVHGAGRVSVWVRLRSGPEQTVLENTTRSSRTTTERDRDGMTREVSEENENTQPVMARTGETALLRRVDQPEVAGVTVVADGARYPTVRERLAAAVEGALNVPVHRIHIVPREGR